MFKKILVIAMIFIGTSPVVLVFAAPADPNDPEVTMDTDNDGIVDKVDQCPDTPSDVVVDRFGCSEDQIAQDNPYVVDTDGD